MDISFKTGKLRNLCNDDRKATRAHGRPCAKKLRSRLDDLADCGNLEEMRFLPGRCHELEGDLVGHFALDLHGGMRLVFVPAEEPPPQKADGGVDWRKVTAIHIVGVRDYHG